MPERQRNPWTWASERKVYRQIPTGRKRGYLAALLARAKTFTGQPVDRPEVWAEEVRRGLKLTTSER